MMGDMENEEFKGLTPRLVESIFQTIYKAPSNLEFTVKVSYMEIYMEKIRDLLNPQQDNLPIHEEKNKGVYVKGLLEVFVGSVDEVYDAMRRGQEARVVASTNMNAESSRSHSIFVIQVNMKNLLDGSSRTGKLYLVDLAGSEKVGKTGATGQTLEEAKKINKSLSALGMVINALTDGKACEDTFICGSVPQSDWVPSPGIKVEGEVTSIPPASVAALAVASMNELGSRAATPAPPIADDEREEFLRRENELADQLAEAQLAVKAKQSEIETLTEELEFLKKRDEETATENKELTATVNDLKLQLEKLACDNKEGSITIDSMKEANNELTREVNELKKKLVDIQSAAPTAPAASQNDEDKERRKQEKMAQMMAEFDPSQGFMTDKEKQIRETLAKLAHMKENSKPPSSAEEIEAQHLELIEAKTQIAQQDQLINELTMKSRKLEETSLAAKKKNEDLESKVTSLEAEYHELLEKTIQEEEHNSGQDLSNVIQDIKGKLETQYNSKREILEKDLHELEGRMTVKDAELAAAQAQLLEAQKANAELKSALEIAQAAAAVGSSDASDLSKKDEEIERMRKTMAQQLGEFDAMKKKLMRDLQNRCEKVVELEISLDETREQYNNILRNSNSRAQQQKMAFLERNLEQLTNVQKQLVEQNSTLKKELAVAERKLLARNERIQNLEVLLHDTQKKLELQNQKFEAQLASMREKLQEARSMNPQGSSWLYSSRIAKPLRGGGANPVAGEGDESQVDMNDAINKRSSWYISLLKKN
ncbi:hypothetical protein HDU96_000585 [Phlyctochytrium bullatum]|nr:hypothetical protein HDU96_000585 [Phlyctochytrium bullatum]